MAVHGDGVEQPLDMGGDGHLSSGDGVLDDVDAHVPLFIGDLAPEGHWVDGLGQRRFRDSLPTLLGAILILEGKQIRVLIHEGP